MPHHPPVARNAAEEELEEAQEEQSETLPQDRGGAGPLPAGSDAALAAPASPRGPGVVRPQPKRSAVEAQRGESGGH